MITITQFLGPSNGQSRQFNDANARIEFGGDATCIAGVPEDKKTAGPRQFALGRDPAAEVHQQIKFITLLHFGQSILAKPRGHAPA
ncbi:MAG: hypothetical protein ABSC72_08360 [Methylovirgula sp.]|jgi:hypothetical protein